MSTSELPNKPRLALFDLDHTLLPLDSDHGWGEFSIAIGWCDRDAFGRQQSEINRQAAAQLADKSFIPLSERHLQR